MILPKKLRDTLASLQAFAPDEAARTCSRHRWDAMSKPLGSLGVFEDIVCKIAALTGDAHVDFRKRAVILFCADNGVVAQGVTQCGKEVTAAVAKNFTEHSTCVCRMAALTHTDTIPVDIGMDAPKVAGVWDYRAANGTKDFTIEPAMTANEAQNAIFSGMEIALRCKNLGYRLLITGEMGIGNTTTTAALASVLCGLAPEKTTGCGAGLSSEGLARKVAAVKKGIALHRPSADEPFELLCALGGLDIAGMVGLIFGGLKYQIPILLDGVICAAAALIAYKLCPACAHALIATHVSAEPAGKALFEQLPLVPFVQAGMRLGEGTGAVICLPMFDIAAELYRNMYTFEENHITPYEHLD